MKKKNRTVLTKNNDQLKRWAEHFKELLNRPTPTDPSDIPPAETPLQVNTNNPSRAEIKEAMKKLNSGKAPGPDAIPLEASKGD